MATKKTEAELLEENDRRAEAGTRALREPEVEYATGKLEFDEQASETEAKAEARALDELSSTAERQQIVSLEEAMASQASLMADLMKQIKGLEARLQAGSLVQSASVADMPKKTKQWTEEELHQKVSIVIFADADPNQNRPVVLHPKAETWIIPRNEPTSIPRYVALCLEHAVIDGWEYPADNGFMPKTDQTPLTLSQPIHVVRPRFNWAYA